LSRKYSRIIRGLEERLSERNRKLFLVLRFLVRFLILAIPLYLFERLDLFALQDLEAKQVSYILNLFGQGSEVVYVNGIPSIVYQGRGIGIIGACTGYRSFFALVALILAVPGVNWRKRKVGLLLALPSIYVFNLTRLVSTVLLSQFIEFQVIHDYLWIYGMTFLVLFLWLFWLKL